MSEPFSQSEAQTCIIIHPGSRYLRIGRPSDSSPHTVLHAIAYKRKNNVVYSDPFLSPISKMDRQTAQEIEDCRLKASHILQMSLMSDGSRRFATPPQQVAAFNKRSQAIVDEDAEPCPDWLNPDTEYVFGDEILSLDPNLNYNIHFPYKRGDLNIHTNLGGSITAVLSFLKAIWGHCISDLLNVPINDLKFYRAVLVIPDIYNRDHVKKLTNLLLCDLGFGCCFVVQDHVAATFGAGLGAACVVDVGEEKTSVSCVEDAISHQQTRIRFDYGGGDVTQVFHWLLRKCHFPHPINQFNKTDAALLSKLKHNFCHLNLNICGPQEKEFTVATPGECLRKYQVQVGDELLIAPLSFFYIELMRITGPKTATYQRSNHGDPDDPFDENFLRDTTRMRGREATESLDVSGMEGGDGPDEDIVVDEHSHTVNNLTGNSSSSSNSVTSSAKTEQLSNDKLLTLEQAILTSIDRCSTDEMKRKMYSVILLVGGGAKFENLGKWLQDRLALQIPVAYRPDQMEIITKPKDLDPAMTVWKGAALFTCLEGSSELWIQQNEWKKLGLRVLRERCPFIW